MSTADIMAMIDGPVLGQSQWMNANYAQQLAGGFQTPPTIDGGPDDPQSLQVLIGSQDFTRNKAFEQPTPDDLVDGQVLGHSGPSLDSYPTVAYRNDRPGFGGFNDQQMMSGRTNFSPGVEPSEEVGTGKPPGWVAAHMPVAMGINAPRAAYAWQGVFADGGNYTGHLSEAERERLHVMRAPWHPATLEQPGQSPNARMMWPGSAVIEQPSTFSLSEILGRLLPDGGGWGVQ